MITAASRTPTQAGSNQLASAIVSSTVATVSPISRSRISRLTYRARSSTTFDSARDPGRFARTRSVTRAREIEVSAASAAAHSPAKGIRTIATASRPAAFIGLLRSVSGRSARFGGAGRVVETDGAQHARVAAPLGLAGGGL